MSAENADRAAAVADLASHLEDSLSPCPAGRPALIEWVEGQLKALAENPVPTPDDAMWLIRNAYIQWIANQGK
ncbi:hypothetical protein ACIPL1_27810 [Pseudomonas sp. NPDC090202]|uniref:hypothetical protein n=1 Tax=Pseudomonas sp. NPDC090202 TaxID=3364476 RepID=UPI00381E556C